MKITTTILALVIIALIYAYNTSMIGGDSLITSMFGSLISWMFVTQVVENQLDN